MNKQQLATKIWESANKMRSKIEANEYKDYILGFIFYKYVSDYQVKFLKENEYDDELLKEVNEEDEEVVQFVQQNIGYFISYDNLFSTWVSKGKDFDVSDVRDALSAFSRLIHKTHKKVFDGIFHTLETGLSKLGGSTGEQTKAINGLLSLIKDIPMDGKQDYDVLGFIYEYLISQFAANAGKKAGEFYTPYEVSVLMSDIVAHHLHGRTEIKIFDPTSGSGSLLINIGQSVEKFMNDKNAIKYYAQELKENTYNLTRMNLVMRGIKPDNIITRNGDTLEQDWPFFEDNDPSETYEALYVDAVVSNPPYSQAWDPTGKENDPRYARFGVAPKTKADYAFLLHDLYHLKPDGIMTIVLPHGVLFRGGEEGNIRKNLIENDHIDTIIGLPSNIFFGTGIPTIIIILKQKRDNNDVLIIDASKEFIKEGKNNKLQSSNIKKIVDTVTNRITIPKYSKVVSKDEIRQNEYNLNIPRYVDSSKKAESYDIYASMFGGIPNNEVNELQDYWDAFPNLKDSIFTSTQSPYVDVKETNIKELIKNHPDILSFKQQFNHAFNNLDSQLKIKLIEQVETIELAKEKTIISNDIFTRLENIKLIDKYQAYQLFDNCWKLISGDIELILNEGFKCITQVDPNMIIKKKDSKEVEVQDGYIGHILPFELVQKTMLHEELEVLEQKHNELASIPSLYEEIIDSLSEEERSGDFLNDTNDAFVMKVVTATVKRMKKENDVEYKELLSKLMQVETISKREKELKKEIKLEDNQLHLKTKEVIENLTTNQTKELLESKWITPLINELSKLTDSIISDIVTKVETMKDKYSTTYLDTQAEIKENEQLLCSMIDELVGDEYDMLGLAKFKELLGGN